MDQFVPKLHSVISVRISVINIKLNFVMCELSFRSFTLYFLRTFGGNDIVKHQFPFFHYAHIWEQNYLTSKIFLALIYININTAGVVGNLEGKG